MIARIPLSSPRFFSKAFAFPFSNLSESSKYSIPYNFSGIPYQPDIKSSTQIRTFLKTLNHDLERGFIYAYNNVLDAIQANDIEYLQNNFENRFFENIEHFPKNLNENNKKLDLVNKENDLPEVFHLDFNMILGVRLRRDSNPNGLFRHDLTTREDSANHFVIYSTSKKHFLLGIQNMNELRPVLQIPIVFKSKKRLVILKKDEKIKEDEIGHESEYHKVLFECEGDDLANMNFFTKIFGILRKNNGERIEGMSDFFRTKIFGNETAWKITDIDDFMKGNPFES